MNRVSFRNPAGGQQGDGEGCSDNLESLGLPISKTRSTRYLLSSEVSTISTTAAILMLEANATFQTEKSDRPSARSTGQSATYDRPDSREMITNGKK